MSLYVATHKKTALPNCEWIVPIGLAGYSDEFVKINDADSVSGKEISSKNRNYCELTGLYWLSQNCNDDIIGLCHYRRYFSFAHFNGVGYNYPAFIHSTEEQTALSYVSSEIQHKTMNDLLDVYKIIVPRPIIHPETVAAAFINAHGKEFWQIFLKACRTEFGNDMRYYEYETRFYFGNMFVAKNDHFKKYCASLFRVIDCVYGEIGDLPDEPGLRYQHFRYPGYLAERFMGIYLHKSGISHFESPTIWINT
jgi:Domain of unknown function (DUF4422)